VRGNTFLRDAVHFLRPDLHLERLAAVEHGGMQRLIKIRPGNGDVVLKSPGDGAPDVVDNAERGVTVALRIGNNAHREKIVNLAETDFLAHDFAVHRVQTFYARFELGGNAGLDELGLDGGLDFLEKFFVEGGLFADFFLQRKERFRLEIAKRQVFEFTADHAHSQAECDGRIDVQRFTGDPLLLVGFEVFERAHVVEPVSQLDEHDANIGDHREEHFADGFRLARFGRHHFEAADFCYPFDEMGDLRSEALFDAGDGILGVFDGVMKNRSGEGNVYSRETPRVRARDRLSYSS